MNIKERLEFELAYYDDAVQYISLYTPEYFTLETNFTRNYLLKKHYNRLGLFSAFRLGNRVHCTSIFAFFM